MRELHAEAMEEPVDPHATLVRVRDIPMTKKPFKVEAAGLEPKAGAYTAADGLEEPGPGVSEYDGGPGAATGCYVGRLGAMLVAAVILRCCNLGTFSLWLDEILLVLRARGTFVETWGACFAHGEHPPLSALVMSILYGVGFSDGLQRLMPILLGLGSIVLLVRWVRDHFGENVALIAGWLAAASPFHIRYSQELRPYAYLLFFAILTLVLADRVVRRPAPFRIVWCGLAAAAGLYSHNLFPLIVAPIVAGVVVEARSPGLVRRTIGLGCSALIALILYLPWLGRLVDLAARPDAGSGQTWVWRFFARRWEFLTVAGREGFDLSWGGILMLLLVGAGLWVCLRRWRFGGLVVVVGAVVGTVGVELFYHFVIERWSVGRYNIIGWPFLIVAAALAIDFVVRRCSLLVNAVLVLALGAAHLDGIADYQRVGREHWDRMAEVIRLVRRPGERVLTANIFCQYGVAYYLCGADALEIGLPREGPVPLNRDMKKLRRDWPSGESCLLVRGGTPHSPELRRLASHFPLVATYADRSWLYRLPPQTQVRWSADGGVRTKGREDNPWPRPTLTLLPERLQDLRRTCLGRLIDGFLPQPGAHGDSHRRFDFDYRSTGESLVGGWSGFETTTDGRTFVWATGLESGLEFAATGAHPLDLELVVWPFSVPGRSQRVRGFVNDRLIGAAVLGDGSQMLQVTIPASALREGRNLLVFQFAYAIAPSEVRSGSRDLRPLACAFDRVELRLRSPVSVTP